jgi:hypothetical protein
MSGPRAPHSLRHEPQSTPLKFEEPVLMWARRVDQRWFSRGSTPMISRIGRFAGSVPGRSANRTPNVSQFRGRRGTRRR